MGNPHRPALSEPFGTATVSHEITQLGRALIRMKGRLASGNENRKKAKAFDPEAGGYPELARGFNLHVPNRAQVGVFHDGFDPSQFQRRPFALNIVPSPGFLAPEELQQWVQEALLGATMEIKGLSATAKSRDPVSMDAFSGAFQHIQRQRSGDRKPFGFYMTNYRPDSTETSGFFYHPGFMIVLKYPFLSVIAGSQNGTGVEARVLTGQYNLNGLVDPENLSPLVTFARAIRRHIFPHAGEGSSQAIPSEGHLPFSVVKQGLRRPQNR